MRFCGATTTVQGQNTVFVNGKLWAVENDPNTHGEGRLIATIGNTIYIEGKLVIVAIGDIAQTDNFGHTSHSVDPEEHSGDVFAY